MNYVVPYLNNYGVLSPLALGIVVKLIGKTSKYNGFEKHSKVKSIKDGGNWIARTGSIIGIMELHKWIM